MMKVMHVAVKVAAAALVHTNGQNQGIEAIGNFSRLFYVRVCRKFDFFANKVANAQQNCYICVILFSMDIFRSLFFIF